MMDIDRFLFKSFGFLILCLISTGGYAEMYKWVDAEGNTQYTQSPPPDGVTADTVEPPPRVDTDGAVKQMEEQKKRSDKYFEDKTKQKEEGQKSEEDLAQKKALCEKARARLASYERPRVNIVNADGTRTRATEEYRQEQLQKSNEDIKKYCGG